MNEDQKIAAQIQAIRESGGSAKREGQPPEQQKKTGQPDLERLKQLTDQIRETRERIEQKAHELNKPLYKPEQK